MYQVENSLLKNGRKSNRFSAFNREACAAGEDFFSSPVHMANSLFWTGENAVFCS
jgi:hypothetical protein